jgi:hypothetical protein
VRGRGNKENNANTRAAKIYRTNTLSKEADALCIKEADAVAASSLRNRRKNTNETWFIEQRAKTYNQNINNSDVKVCGFIC